MIETRTPPLLPLSAMARRVFVPVAWLREEAQAGRLPFLPAGKQMLFDPDLIERMLLERARGEKPEAVHA